VKNVKRGNKVKECSKKNVERGDVVKKNVKM
jgi:hypothetical protein